MAPAEIDLFVDRLCSFWPTTNIARNTLKNGWKHSEAFINATTEEAKQVLTLCKPLPKFPDLNTLEGMFRNLKQTITGTVGCPLCDNTGFIEATPVKQLGYTYRTVRFCTCRKPQ